MRRKTATTMPSPTVTSAAATTITKKTLAWPPMSSSVRENVTKVRLAAFSISSMHMNMMRALRRVEQPEGPDAEEQRGEHEVPGGGDVHDGTSSSTRGGRLVARSPRVARSRRASSTAPTTAMIEQRRRRLEREEVRREDRPCRAASRCRCRRESRRPTTDGRAGHPVRAP